MSSVIKRRKLSKSREDAPRPQPKRPTKQQVRDDPDSDDDSESQSSKSSSGSSQDSCPKPPTAEETNEEQEERSEEAPQSFKELGIVESLCEACDNLGWKTPTPIQQKAIPQALANKDIIGLAETGSGKTAAFALPILQSLLEKPQPFFGLILSPTRELAAQIAQAFEALGSLISLRCALIVGGLDMVPQALALGRKPHIIVATPGRLLDHLEKTKGFSLRNLRYLVMDEADRMLDMDFAAIIDKILRFVPRDRRTFLFSATISSKVESLQRASLRDPVKVSVSSKIQTVKTLQSYYLFIPHAQKDLHLVYLMNEFAGQSVIIFSRTVWETQRLSILLRALGFSAIPLHGQLSQSARLGALNKFKTGARSILVATDVAARGLDIPKVDIVLQYDQAGDSKTYIHRVGRTARAGKSGKAISLLSQYDIEIFLRTEKALGGKKTAEYPIVKEEVMVFQPRVEEAQRHARTEIKSLIEDRGKKGAVLRGKGGMAGKRRRDDMDAEEG